MLSRAGVPGLALLVYDNSGLPYVMGLGNGQNSFFGHDALGRLTGLTHDLSGTANDVTFGLTYNPASEIATSTRDNDAYAYTGHANANVASTANGLNQLTALGGTSVSHSDGRGNVTAIGSASYGYDSENRLTSAPGGVSLSYDPVGRLYQVSDGTTTRRFLYDGQIMIAEYDGSNAIVHRYVHGEGIDNPIVQYDGSGFSGIHFLHADERGSVVAVSGASGALENVNRYDEYGVPQGTLTGRFGYTGQMWLPEAGLYHYRARAYNPVMGRFMQVDPIGYQGGINLYAYVLNNPVNFTDPSGLGGPKNDDNDDDHVIVIGKRPTSRPAVDLGVSGGLGGIVPEDDRDLAALLTARIPVVCRGERPDSPACARLKRQREEALHRWTQSHPLPRATAPEHHHDQALEKQCFQ